MTRDGDGELWSFWDELVRCRDDRARMLQLIVERAATLVGEVSVLNTISDDRTRLEPAAIHHDDPEARSRLRAILAANPSRIGEGIAGRVAADRRPAVLRGEASASIAPYVQPHNRELAEQHPIKALLIVPMVAFGEVVGTLGVLRFTSTEPYTDEDVLAVEALAERAALAITDARPGRRSLGPADLEAIYLNNLDAILFSSADGRVLAANPAACELLGRTEDEICQVGRPGILVEEDPTTRELVAERDRVGRARGEIPVRRANGENFLAEVSSSIFTTPEGELRAYVMIRDVSEQAALRDRLAEQAELLEQESQRDALTDLRNRRGFLNAAGEALAIAAREGRPVQMLFFDLDGLKTVNDTIGHLAGDALLVRLASAIATETRDVDVSARLGGDEFVLLLFSATEEDANAVIERIRRRVAGSAGPPVGFSVGRAVHQRGSSETLDQLLHRADAAMYEAKVRRRFGDASP